MIEEPQIISKNIKIKKYGNKYLLNMDYKSELPESDKKLLLVNLVSKGVLELLSPKTIKDTVKNIKAKEEDITDVDIKNITNEEKIVNSNTNEVMKKLGVKNPDVKALEYKPNYKKEILDKWGTSSEGKNQGIKYLIEKETGRIERLEKNLGLSKGSFEKSHKGLEKFTREAEKVIKNATGKEKIGDKTFYYIDGIEKTKKGVMVIKYKDKLQSMMPSSPNLYKSMIRQEIEKLNQK